MPNNPHNPFFNPIIVSDEHLEPGVIRVNASGQALTPEMFGTMLPLMPEGLQSTINDLLAGLQSHRFGIQYSLNESFVGVNPPPPPPLIPRDPIPLDYPIKDWLNHTPQSSHFTLNAPLPSVLVDKLINSRLFVEKEQYLIEAKTWAKRIGFGIDISQYDAAIDWLNRSFTRIKNPNDGATIVGYMLLCFASHQFKD